MAFDPQREDYQRLGLQFANSLSTASPTEATRAFASFGRRFARDRDSLPQSDADRAFGLVAAAAKNIDYELPFATDEEAEQIIARGHALLDEAISLDAQCYDALRMKAAAEHPSFESFYAFLFEQSDEVRRACEERRDKAAAACEGDERAQLAASIAMRPYVRWVATQAEQALICGRNKEALRWAHIALETDSRDTGDVRFTAALTYAKLEDEQGLDALTTASKTHPHTRPSNDAWTQIARMAIAYKRYDLTEAAQLFDQLARTYPHAAESFVRQLELPDGVFARLAVRPYSEDELVLALSEATVLLQEGRDPDGRGALGSWVANQAAARLPQSVLAMLAAEAEARAQDAGTNGADQGGMS